MIWLKLRSFRQVGKYEVRLEIGGPTAIWTRPDSGDAPTSYPVPTRSAVKGIFESVLWLPTAVVLPTRVEVCAPIIYHTYTTNYGGPLRKTGKPNFQLIATVLINVCYRLYAEIRQFDGPAEQVPPSARSWLGKNCAHAYQEIFDRRIRRGQWGRTPCLGWQEFVPDYLGPFRTDGEKITSVQSDLNLSIPGMLEYVFPRQNDPTREPLFRQRLDVINGVLVYAT
jgi:CRISPR-associated protein Cas5d